MPFHRTPAEMAADACFMLSGIGTSKSRHLLWLTDEDLFFIGPEPIRAHAPSTGRIRIDYGNPAQVQAEREHVRLWNAWWGRVSDQVGIRRREALSDPAWQDEYHLLLLKRRDEAPAELAAFEARSEAFEAAHPMRGLTQEEEARKKAAWKRRGELVAEYHRVRRKSKDSPRLEEILKDMKECDRISDDLYDLSVTRPTYAQAA